MVLLRPSHSRGTDLPATGLPLIVALADGESRNSENISCRPVADWSFISSTMNGAESSFQVKFTWPMALRNHSLCEVRPSPPATKSQAGFICTFASPLTPLNAPKLETKPFLTYSASGSLSVRQTLGFSGLLPSPCGSSNMKAAWPFPCGEVTTRKKLMRLTNGPSAASLRYMPGFSPDQSTCCGLNGGLAIFFSSLLRHVITETQRARRNADQESPAAGSQPGAWSAWGNAS